MISRAAVMAVAFAAMMFVTVMVTQRIGVILEPSRQKRGGLLIRVSGGAGEDGDPGLCQGSARAAADAAANERVDVMCL